MGEIDNLRENLTMKDFKEIEQFQYFGVPKFVYQIIKNLSFGFDLEALLSQRAKTKEVLKRKFNTRNQLPG